MVKEKNNVLIIFSFQYLLAIKLRMSWKFYHIRILYIEINFDIWFNFIGSDGSVFEGEYRNGKK